MLENTNEYEFKKNILILWNLHSAGRRQTLEKNKEIILFVRRVISAKEKNKAGRLGGIKV